MVKAKNQRQRAVRGAVTVNQRGEQLQLRWTYGGKRFYLSAGLNTPLNLFSARKLADTIGQDILIGAFDPTLERYKPKPQEPEPVKLSTVELFEQYIEHRRQEEGTSDQAISSRYKPMLSNLRRFGRSIESEADARQFVDLLRSRQSPRIANQNLSMLRGFADWAVEQSAMPSNWFKGIKSLKASKRSKSKSPTRKPFEHGEILKLLEKAKNHPSFYQWHDFCMVLLYLGLRPSEAIGLRWCDVDLTRGEIDISSSLARGENGRSAGTSRVRKPTKTENSRVLTLPESLLDMLRGRAAATTGKLDDLIFLSPKGKPIDDHNFSQRVWKKLCAAAGVPYRVPYACRHTLLSHGIEQGMTLPQAAFIAGHTNTRMVVETYGHMINRPTMIDWQHPT